MEPRSKAAFATGFAAALLLGTAQAGAVCVAPRLFAQPPGQPAGTRPRPPDCLDRFTYPPAACDERELRLFRRQLDGFRAEVEHFARRARGYAEEVADFARDAELYADCEVRELGRP